MWVQSVYNLHGEIFLQVFSVCRNACCNLCANCFYPVKLCDSQTRHAKIYEPSEVLDGGCVFLIQRILSEESTQSCVQYGGPKGCRNWWVNKSSVLYIGIFPRGQRALLDVFDTKITIFSPSIIYTFHFSYLLYIYCLRIHLLSIYNSACLN